MAGRLNNVPLLFLAATLFGPQAWAQDSGSCIALTKLVLPQVKIVAAELVSAAAAAGEKTANSAAGVPPYCRVQAQLTPTPNSDIKVEIWLPVTWNGMFRGQGNGGFAGSIDHEALARAAAQGYATASTDTGHTGGGTDAGWALEHPEKIVDFGYRAIHEMTVAAQAVIGSFYGTSPKHSFFSACSNGGRQALMEAERFPADYDGIIAGAPAWNWTALMSSAVASAQALDKAYIPASKLPAISAAVLATCDVKDGVQDGILSDPRSCHLPPKALLCRHGDQPGCLTKPQFSTLQALYAGPHAKDGRSIFPGFLPGAELGPGGWSAWITGDAPEKSALFAFGQGFFSNMVYRDPAWTPEREPVPAAYAAAGAVAGELDASNANLAPFFGRGGKLILYHGWNDPAISPLSTLDFVDRLRAATSAEAVAANTRLYMVPGMQHCAGGPGPSFFGQLGWFPAEGDDDARHDVGLALEQWVKKGVAPETIVATRYEGAPAAANVTMQRPLCPYPQTAKYDGTGDPSVATSFACTRGEVSPRRAQKLQCKEKIMRN